MSYVKKTTGGAPAGIGLIIVKSYIEVFSLQTGHKVNPYFLIPSVQPNVAGLRYLKPWILLQWEQENSGIGGRLLDSSSVFR